MVKSKLNFSASPSVVTSYNVEISTPSKSSFILKLTTPPIASEPYTAEAPPVMISTFSIREAGIVFKSTTPDWLAGTQRRPLTITKVREVPKPRKSTVAVPSPGLFELGPNEGKVEGNSASFCSMLRLPEIANS